MSSGERGWTTGGTRPAQGWAASSAAAAAMAGWNLFGRNSLAAKVSRITSYASLALGIGRGVSRLRKFW